MELGEKLRLARQEAGLSQRQVCGDTITRNMLSQIEHGTARPSMETLRQLAARLGKPVSFFLEEDVVVSPNQELMGRARTGWEEGRYTDVWLLLKDFRTPDPVLEWEWKYLSFASALKAAEAALESGKNLYARQLLEEAGEIDHRIPELERQRLLLLGRVPEADLGETVRWLSSLDEELLLRAEAALKEKNTARAETLLAAAEDTDAPRWNLLRGKVLMQKKDYSGAAERLEKAEKEFPKQCCPLLEICFRETGDFRKAYEYACKQR